MAKDSPDKKPVKVRNLTYESMLEYLEGQKAAALEGIPEYEAVEVSVTERDAKGVVVMKNGFPSLVKQAVLKRDVAALAWDKKISEVKALIEAA